MNLRKATALILLLLAGTPLAAAPPRDRPNVVLIVIDDLNDWVGCLGGHPQASTPNIDGLARRGVLFRNAHTQSPICNPSRASFLASLYPESTGIYFNAGTLDDAKVAGDRLLTRRFAAAGYRVKGAGKISDGQEARYLAGHAGSFGGFGPLPDKKLAPFAGHRLWDWGALPVADDAMPDHRIAAWAARELQQPQEGPLFLAAGFYRPHVPMYAPQPWFDALPEATVRLPELRRDDLADLSRYAIDLTRLEHIEPPHPWIVEQAQWRPLVQAYLACIRFVDDQVGRIVRAVEAGPHRDNTLIVLFGDHGFHLGEKEVWAKQTLWEDSTRVPLIIAGPGIPEGRVCERPVQLLDVMPTLVDLCGLPSGRPMDGRSLAPLLKNPDADWPHFARTSFGPGNVALRSTHYRFIRYLDGSEEFYDHRSDPHEWDNRIGDASLAATIAAHRAQLPTSARPIVGSGSTGHRAYAAAAKAAGLAVPEPSAK
jgi:arylsulfatase A-like enzyme